MSSEHGWMQLLAQTLVKHDFQDNVKSAIWKTETADSKAIKFKRRAQSSTAAYHFLFSYCSNSGSVSSALGHCRAGLLPCQTTRCDQCFSFTEIRYRMSGIVFRPLNHQAGQLVHISQNSLWIYPYASWRWWLTAKTFFSIPAEDFNVLTSTTHACTHL